MGTTDITVEQLGCRKYLMVMIGAKDFLFSNKGRTLQSGFAYCEKANKINVSLVYCLLLVIVLQSKMVLNKAT